MGRRSGAETISRILVALLGQRTWRQSELARHVGVSARRLGQVLRHLEGAGVPLDRDNEWPHVYWSVPRTWFPGGQSLAAADAAILARLVARLPRSRERQDAIERLLGGSMLPVPREDRSDPSVPGILTALEDAAAQRTPAHIRYYSASRGEQGDRHVSIHRLLYGDRPRFVAVCHRTGDLKCFRIDRVERADLDPAVPFRVPPKEQLDEYVRSILGGYGSGHVLESSFSVRSPESRWVIHNLPDGNTVIEHNPRGIRVRARTAGVSVLARFVAGLGEAAVAETKELRDAVVEIAQGTLRNLARRAPVRRGAVPRRLRRPA